MQGVHLNSGTMSRPSSDSDVSLPSVQPAGAGAERIRLRDIEAPVLVELRAFREYYRMVLTARSGLQRVVMRYVLRAPGKQLRPLLVFLSAGAAGCISHAASVGAAMVELVHNASLLHDDVIDRGDLRRGLPTVSRMWGEKGAVLAGDYMLGLGLKLAVDSGRYDLLRYMNEAVQRMAQSEITQLYRSLRTRYDEAGYLEVIAGKTAALFSTCTRAGARSATETASVIRALGEYGHNIGMAFQIRDDLLDWRPSYVTGKTSGADIREGKVTLPLIHAIGQARTPLERSSLVRDFRRSRRNFAVRMRLRKRVEESGGLAYAEQSIARYTDLALASLDSLPESAYRDSLTKLAHYLRTRKR